jgi:hypothetical protein
LRGAGTQVQQCVDAISLLSTCTRTRWFQLHQSDWKGNERSRRPADHFHAGLCSSARQRRSRRLNTRQVLIASKFIVWGPRRDAALQRGAAELQRTQPIQSRCDSRQMGSTPTAATIRNRSRRRFERGRACRSDYPAASAPQAADALISELMNLGRRHDRQPAPAAAAAYSRGLSLELMPFFRGRRGQTDGSTSQEESSTGFRAEVDLPAPAALRLQTGDVVHCPPALVVFQHPGARGRCTSQTFPSRWEGVFVVIRFPPQTRR